MSEWSRRHVLAVVAVALVAAAVVYGLVLAGPPRDERERRLDQRRTQDLQSIGRAIDLYWTRHGHFPMRVATLTDTSVLDILHDPDTGQPYEYRVLTDSTFELCGIFTTEWSSPAGNVFWSHPPGRACFNLEVRAVQRTKAIDDGP